MEYEKDRHETKNVLKRMVYRTLSEVSGKELPWGDLTGIRPTKIPMKMLEEGKKCRDCEIHARNLLHQPGKDGTCDHDCQPGEATF